MRPLRPHSGALQAEETWLGSARSRWRIGRDLDLVRNPTGGFGADLLTGTQQGATATTETPSASGELASLVATESSNPLYSLDVSYRDALGRIETKVEAIGAGPSTTTVYTYDPAGRLDTVTVGGTLVADYAYDPNGNRTHEREHLPASVSIPR